MSAHKKTVISALLAWSPERVTCRQLRSASVEVYFRARNLHCTLRTQTRFVCWGAGSINQPIGDRALAFDLLLLTDAPTLGSATVSPRRECRVHRILRSTNQFRSHDFFCLSISWLVYFSICLDMWSSITITHPTYITCRTSTSRRDWLGLERPCVAYFVTLDILRNCVSNLAFTNLAFMI